MNNEERKPSAIEVIEVQCRKCGKIWMSTINAAQFSCLGCGCSVDPNKDAIIDEEKIH